MARESKGLQRRSFFNDCLKKLFSEIDANFGEELNGFCRFFPELIRPPGAEGESIFLEKCRRCSKCVKACPFNAIAPELSSTGFDRETPTLRQGAAYCRFCQDFPCIAACPEGALSLKNLENPPRIGIASIIQQQCLRQMGENCKACMDICTQAAKAAVFIDSDGRLKIKADVCNGCGACAVVCPGQPSGAIKIIR